ncbi:MFS transporter [Ensifer sp.]|uniref:MFS transporter n=1 Tax=Ensifer sp. TaxID=1872086 RepID=UPI0028989599|nr:MFS transporter [Ensifer sp.]
MQQGTAHAADVRSLQPDRAAKANAVYSKVFWRLVPLLFICYVASYLDRVNVGFAKLQMMSDLSLSDTVYGIGAGIFFIGYFVFEVPSNIILSRVGAKGWIARIMVTWGIISAAMMFVTSAEMFYVLRFLLGVAEAGFFPGVILYLTYWFPAERRARIVATFMTGIAFAGVIGGPLSGWIMQEFAGVNGWTGWQWMFLLEGIPSVLLGVFVLFYLDNSVRSAKWLSDEEKALIEADLANDNGKKQTMTLGSVFRNGKVWLLSGIYFCCIMGLYGISFWLPQLIKNAGAKDVMEVGFLTAIPYAVAAVGMVLISRNSDLAGERRWHIAVCAVIGAVGLLLSTLVISSIPLSLAALSLATLGILTTLPLFWTLPTGYLGGVAAAAGIAIINSIGNLAGFVSPYLIGAVRDATGSTDAGMYALVASLCIGAVCVIAFIPKAMQR